MPPSVYKPLKAVGRVELITGIAGRIKMRNHRVSQIMFL